MQTKPALIALFACANSVLASPFGFMLNECEGKKKGDQCELFLPIGATFQSVCIEVAVSRFV